MKLINYFFSYTAALSFLLIILYFSFSVFAFNSSFFSKEFESYNANIAVKMEMDALMRVTYHMIDYLDGKKDDLVITEEIDGVNREFFNAKEKHHMDDVKILFENGKVIRNISIVLLIISISIVFFLKDNFVKNLLIALRNLSLAILLFMFILFILAATSFTKYFTIFHEIFFTNNLWLLDPSTDLLINILPESFFVNIAFCIASTFIGFLIVFMVVPYLLLRQKKNLNISSTKR